MIKLMSEIFGKYIQERKNIGIVLIIIIEYTYMIIYLQYKNNIIIFLSLIKINKKKRFCPFTCFKARTKALLIIFCYIYSLIRKHKKACTIFTYFLFFLSF